MLARERVIAVLALLLGCTPAPPEVADTGPSGDPEGSTGGASTGTPPGSTTGEGSATVASAEGTSGSSEGPATTLPVDGTGTTTDEPPATSGSSEGPGSSSDGGMMESSTGEPADCHPILAEVLYELPRGDNDEEWVKLYNPCAVQIELDGYSLGWGGTSYTDTGTADLLGAIAAGGCFLVGGPNSNAENANPMFDSAMDFDADLENSGSTADGIALFLGDAASITAVTVPVDAVIYGENNSSNLIDAEGNVPNPHVADAPEGRSIRRTALTATWVVEPSPMPNGCPPL